MDKNKTNSEFYWTHIQTAVHTQNKYIFINKHRNRLNCEIFNTFYCTIR